MSFWCKILGHRWDACRCQRCGQQRDKKHRFAAVEGKCAGRCEVCGKAEQRPHQWHHCVCNCCGEVRDEDHDWLYTTECEQVCRLCGAEHAEHRWQPVDRGVDRCRNCGKIHKLTPEEIEKRDEEWASEYE